MKIQTSIFSVLLTALFSAVLAGQSTPAAAGDVFTSSEDGFSIQLSAKDFETKKSDTSYGASVTRTWMLPEGVIIVRVMKFTTFSFDTDELRRRFLDGYRSGLAQEGTVKVTGEAPFAIGDFKGAAYTCESSGLKCLSRVVLLGKRFYDTQYVASAVVPGAEKILLQKLDSLKILPVSDPAAK